MDKCSKIILIASISLHAEVKPAGEPPIHAMSSTPLHLGEPYKWIGENLRTHAIVRTNRIYEEQEVSQAVLSQYEAVLSRCVAILKE